MSHETIRKCDRCGLVITHERGDNAHIELRFSPAMHDWTIQAPRGVQIGNRGNDYQTGLIKRALDFDLCDSCTVWVLRVLGGDARRPPPPPPPEFHSFEQMVTKLNRRKRGG